MDVQRSFAVFTMASLITFISMIIISATEQGKLSFLQIFFEVMSAFGTCGLSLGVTSDINDITKVVLMILMFIGRVGLISFIIMLAGRKEPEKYSYLKNVYKLDNHYTISKGIHTPLLIVFWNDINAIIVL